jgi:hypothetical protein
VAVKEYEIFENIVIVLDLEKMKQNVNKRKIIRKEISKIGVKSNTLVI